MPSPWIVQWAGLVAADATVLDVAAGGGRHTRFFADRGHKVTAIDRDVSALAAQPNVEIVQADLEDGSPWPLPGRTFGAVVVTNYLHRPLFPALLDALAPGGVLLYETFMEGNERFGRPSQPGVPAEGRRAAGAGARPLLRRRLRGADDQRTEDGDGPAHRRTEALTTRPPSRRPACAARARRTSGRASATAPSCAPRRSWRDRPRQ